LRQLGKPTRGGGANIMPRRRYDELIQVHKEAQEFDLAHRTQAASPTPYHPGAVKYFGERGIQVN
jgi:TRAP-type uncharacterized transport system substrate-binding protein